MLPRQHTRSGISRSRCAKATTKMTLNWASKLSLAWETGLKARRCDSRLTTTEGYLRGHMAKACRDSPGKHLSLFGSIGTTSPIMCETPSKTMWGDSGWRLLSRRFRLLPRFMQLRATITLDNNMHLQTLTWTSIAVPRETPVSNTTRGRLVVDLLLKLLLRVYDGYGRYQAVVNFFEEENLPEFIIDNPEHREPPIIQASSGEVFEMSAHQTNDISLHRLYHACGSLDRIQNKTLQINAEDDRGHSFYSFGPLVIRRLLRTSTTEILLAEAPVLGGTRDRRGSFR